MSINSLACVVTFLKYHIEYANTTLSRPTIILRCDSGDVFLQADLELGHSAHLVVMAPNIPSPTGLYLDLPKVSTNSSYRIGFQAHERRELANVEMSFYFIALF